MNTLFHFLRRTPSAVLLLLQLIILLTTPLLADTASSHAVSWALGTLALILVAVIIRFSPVFNAVGFVLVGVALTVSALVAWAGMADLAVWANVAEAMAYFYAAWGMVMYMLDDHEVTRDELFAAAAVFTLMAWGFAFLYSACQILYPHSFTAAVNVDAPRTWLELLFLSFTSMSSTGLGDIIPITPPARVISAIQMFTGVMYVALIVSRLVGMAGVKTSK